MREKQREDERIQRERLREDERVQREVKREMELTGLIHGTHMGNVNYQVR